MAQPGLPGRDAVLANGMWKDPGRNRKLCGDKSGNEFGMRGNQRPDDVPATGLLAYHFGWRNVLNVPRFRCQVLPRIQDLPHSRLAQPIALSNIAAIPSQHKVELGDLALQLDPVVFRERWDLGRKTDTVRPNGLPEILDIYFAEIHVLDGI
jgi:hypothetical protein